jgi:hypothetical protein
MKKLFLMMTAVVAVSVLSTSAKAQDINVTDVKGKNFLNAGVGLGTFGFNGTGGLPVTASFEHGFTDKVSAGVYLGMIQRKWYGDVTYNYKVIGVRGSYHFNEILKVTNDKLDLYGGASLYYRGYSAKYELPGELGGGKEKVTSGGLSFALHAGTRYQFAKNIGAFAEVGYGVSPLQLGLSFVF